MGVEETRERLIQLEIEARDTKEVVEDTRSQLDKLLSKMDAGERQEKDLKAEIKATREELLREESLAASREQAEMVNEEQARFIGKFTALAEDRCWYEGIFDHQWHGMMFGAVAKRWILGDGMGLGKTRTAIGWLDLVGAKRVIIVCEPNICDQFAGEVMELAPHRTITNLYSKLKARRHELLDAAIAHDEGVIIINYEIWRKDRDTLAKLLGWQAEALIVDEAHNLKTTATANFRDIKILLTVDNQCPKCGGLLKGLYDQTKEPRKVPKPCENCGWMKGEPTPKRYLNRLDNLLSTRSIKYVLFTTGTPILNDPGDIYSLLHLCDPVLFPTRSGFLKTYCTKNYHSDKWEWRGAALDNLKPLIEGRFLARTYEDADIVIPKQFTHVIRVDLNKTEYPLQHRTIQQINEAAMIQLDSGEQMTIMHMLALITRKRQANVWPAGIVVRDTNKLSPTFGEIIFSVGAEVQESAKIDAMIEHILELLPKRQVVFSQFKDGLKEMEQRLLLAGVRVVRFDGDTPKSLREQVKLNFDRANDEEAKWDVVLCNYKTGGTGLNLTEATIIHISDEEWNPGKRNQAYGRTHRIGQIEEGDVYVYRVPNSIDTWMSNIINRKEGLIGQFTGTMTSPKEMAIDLAQQIKEGTIL